MSEIHLPNFYSDEDWNDLSDEERERSSQLYAEAEFDDDTDLNERIQALYDEANEYDANAEGTSDIIHARALREEAEQLINIQRERREQEGE